MRSSPKLDRTACYYIVAVGSALILSNELTSTWGLAIGIAACGLEGYAARGPRQGNRCCQHGRVTPGLNSLSSHSISVNCDWFGVVATPDNMHVEL